MSKQAERLNFFSVLFLMAISAGLSAQSIVIEAEAGNLLGDNTRIENTMNGFSGTGYVSGFEATTDGVSVTFNLDNAGDYSLFIGFSAPYGPKDNYIVINGEIVDTLHFPEISGFSEILVGDFAFNAGENTLIFSSFWGWSLLDYFKISDIAPRGEFMFIPESPATGDTITFDASGTYDPNGTIDSYVWDFGDSQTATGMLTKHVFNKEGQKTVTLTITDNDGNATKLVKQFEVSRTEPYAVFSISEEFPIPLSSITFDGTLSYDLTGSVDSWDWNFGDGNTSTASAPTHSYAVEGNYNVSLTVTNNRGKTDTRITTIFVYEDTVIIRGPILLTMQPKTYEKVELAFQVKGDFSNPFNPEEVMVDAIITLPSGTDSIVVPCFYYEESYYQQGQWYLDSTIRGWRLRFLPIETGEYRIKIKYTGSESVIDSEYSVIVAAGSSKGIIRADEANNQYYRHETGELYFPLGINIGWNDIESYSKIMRNIADYHGNFFRYWHTPFAQQALEWTDTDFYDGLGKYSQVAAAMTDSLLNLGKELDVYMQLVIFQHGMFSENVNEMWENNPYNINNGGFVERAEEYFYNNDCKIYAKKLLRYIIARWSYSPNIFAWEFFNEVQFTGIHPSQTAQWFPGVLTWHSEMSRYVESIDPYNHLMTTSAEDAQIIELDSIKNLDILQYHLYSTDLLNQQKNRDYSFKDTLLSAIINGEYGEDVTTANVPLNKQEISLWNAIMTEVPHVMWLWDNYDEPEWGKVFYYPGEFLKDEDFTQYSEMSEPIIQAVYQDVDLSTTCLGSDSNLFGVVYHPDNTIDISDAVLKDVVLPYGYYRLKFYIASSEKIIDMDSVPLIRQFNEIKIPDFNNSAAFKIKFLSPYQNPIALAGQDFLSPMGVQITLDGSQSFDPLGGTLSYNWTLFEKPATSALNISDITTPTFNFEPDVAGYYYFKLEVSNGTRNAIPDTILVIASTKPVAIAGEDGTVAPRAYFKLDGTASYDPDGEEITFLWKIVDQPELSNPVIYNSTKSTAQFRSNTIGDYTVTLTVSDGIQLSEPDTVNIIVKESTGIIDLEDNMVQIFPIPAKDNLYIQIFGVTNIEAEMMVYDIYGRLLIQKALNPGSDEDQNTFVIELAEVNKGWYILKINFSGRTFVRKFLKE